jgi:NAD-dependent deacetylase
MVPGDRERLAELLRSSGPAVVLTGAGISVPSGIPDFRTPMTGLWANVDPMEVAHIDVWRRDPKRFWDFYGQRFAILDGKQPNGAHRAIAELERRGLVSGVVTQNIDGLHALAGSDPIEVHGSIQTASCLACGASYSLAETRARGEVPLCECGAVLKPDVVLFGEMLPERAMLRATALAMNAGLMLAVGSSLEVWPVAGLPEDTLRAGGKLAIVTMGETPYDRVAEVKLSGDVVAELEAVLALLGGVEGAGPQRGLEA